ncbi:MAG TPA: hypothetical protein VMR25_03055 [Planctomycetaceae bacterium]|nr:hypothetical protein [Planctomycetaceae bacterium]
MFYDVALETPDRRQLDVKIGLDGRIKADGEGQDDAGWTRDFSGDKDQLTSTGRNPFFILEPGYQSVLEEGKDRMTVTVLDETKIIDGVETRVVEQRVTSDSQLVEVDRDYFAISKRTNSVYHFGADVDVYKEGKLAGHDGSWLAGANEARFGLAMPGLPLLGAKYYQDVAPGAAMDRAEIVGLDKEAKVPAGEFKNCLVVLESTALDPKAKKPKFYASGVGLLRDGTMSLVRYGKAAAAKN